MPNALFSSPQDGPHSPEGPTSPACSVLGAELLVPTTEKRHQITWLGEAIGTPH